MKTNYYYKTMPSVVGKLKLVANDEGLAAILWENDKPKRVPLGPLVKNDGHRVLAQAEREVAEYLAGKRRKFAVRLAARGTDFQAKVWRALKAIPFGETRSYGQIAKQMGQPKAARAVGAATGRNPVSIIVPCHRVIGASGKLTGFAGGLKTKERLLALEGGRNAAGINGGSRKTTIGPRRG